MGWLLNAIPRWLAGQVAAALNRLWGLLSGTVLWVPDVTALPQVQRLTGTSLAVVNTGFVLAVIAAGVTVMTRETLQVRYGIGELAPRLVVAFVAANLAGPITRGLIGGANALTVGLTGEGSPSPVRSASWPGPWPRVREKHRQDPLLDGPRGEHVPRERVAVAVTSTECLLTLIQYPHPPRGVGKPKVS